MYCLAITKAIEKNTKKTLKEHKKKIFFDVVIDAVASNLLSGY